MAESSHVPIVIGNAAPFRLVVRDEDHWNPSLEDINRGQYDYVKLHRLSAFVDVGIAPYSLGIGFDGSLVLPATDDYKDRDAALAKFNQVLGQLLLGGVYTEAVSPEDITFGTLTLDGYFRGITCASGPVSRFHQAIRQKMGGVLDLGRLVKPRKIAVGEVESSLLKGKEVLATVDRLSAGILLNGVTYLVRHQWAEALVGLWTSIEQVVSHIWDTRIAKCDSDRGAKIVGRGKFLQDFRTWTTSARVEVLYQKGLIGAGEYNLLNKARKARNEFVHSGKTPKRQSAEASAKALFGLMSLVIANYKDSGHLSDIYERILRNVRGSFVPKERVVPMEEVSWWIEIPPIPGDPRWGDRKYDVVESLRLKPVSKEI
ncbi:MAG: hypothetical protein GY719_40655 [bacterium]|nr:hypothetical protein [bacterium]